MNISNKHAKMSLFTVFSIIALILFMIAAWIMLGLSLNTYKKMAKSKSQSKYKSKSPIKMAPIKANNQLKQLPKPKKMTSSGHIQSETNPIIKKLAIGYYLLKAKMENANNQQSIAENEKIAINILIKYNKAQDVYFKHYEYYAKTPDKLIIEGENVYSIIDPDLWLLNSANTPKQAIDGYYYVQTRNPGSELGKDQRYLLNAIPADYGNSGLNTFYIDQKGIVIESNNGAKPVYRFSDQQKSNQ